MNIDVWTATWLHNFYPLKTSPEYTLLKPKRHYLRCHDFVVHTLLLRMNNNVVDFRVMRRLCHRQWNWQAKLTKREPHSWDPRQQTTWSRLVTSDFNSVYSGWGLWEMCVMAKSNQLQWVKALGMSYVVSLIHYQNQECILLNFNIVLDHVLKVNHSRCTLKFQWHLLGNSPGPWAANTMADFVFCVVFDSFSCAIAILVQMFYTFVRLKKISKLS